MHWVVMLRAAAAEEPASVAYVEADQVYLRAEGAIHAPIVDVLPYSTEVTVESGEVSPGGYVAVRVVGTATQGFIHASRISAHPQGRTARPEGMSTHFCGCFPPERHASLRGDWIVAPALAANDALGEPYCVWPTWDDYCSPVRPNLGLRLGELERSLGPSSTLLDHEVSWTLAFAPESAYRQDASLAVLQASPLLQPLAARPHPPQPIFDGMLAEVFGSGELRTPRKPPADIWLHGVLVEGERLLFPGRDVAASMGPVGGFPGLTPQLDARWEIGFRESLSVVVFEPCRQELHSSTLSDLRYVPSRGELTGALEDADLRASLSSCSASLAAESRSDSYAHPGYRAGLEFFVLIDGTPDARALQALSGDAVVRRSPVFESPNEGLHAVELQVQRGGETTAFVRAYTMPDCGVARYTTVQLLLDGVWERVSMYQWDSSDCGA